MRCRARVASTAGNCGRRSFKGANAHSTGGTISCAWSLRCLQRRLPRRCATAAVHLLAELQRAFPDEMRSGGWGQRAVQFASAIVNAAAATTDVVPSTVADAGADANAPMPHAQTASLALLPALELLCVTGCTECLKDLLTGEGCLGLLSSALRLVVSIGPTVGTGTCAGQVESEVAQVNGATCGAMADPVALRTGNQRGTQHNFTASSLQ